MEEGEVAGRQQMQVEAVLEVEVAQDHLEYHPMQPTIMVEEVLQVCISKC
jgi:hypothetical protein